MFRQHNQPGYHSARLRKYLEKQLPGFSGLSVSDRQRFTYIFHALYHETYPHKQHEGYCSIPQQIYRNWFGRNDNRDRFKILLDKYQWILINHAYRYDSNWNYGKGYKLNVLPESLLKSFFNTLLEPKLSPTTITKTNGKAVRKLPSNAIYSVDKNYNPAKCNASLSTSVTLNVQALHQALIYAKKLYDYHQHGSSKPLPMTYSKYFDEMRIVRLEKALSQLRKLHDLCYNELLPFGQIPQCYVESASGRLYGSGINLQNVVREVKKVALSGKRVIEYDFSNCHFTILYQIAKSSGVSCPMIKEYLENKTSIRQELATELQIDIKDAKQCLLCLIYGARLVPYYKNSIPELIGVEKAKQLFQHKLFASLKTEIDKAGEVLISNANRHKGRIVNKMGKSINPNEKKSVILSHLLQGYEAKMLNIVLNISEKNILIPQHDGWIAKYGQDLDKIKKQIWEDTNIEISIKKEIAYSNL